MRDLVVDREAVDAWLARWRTALEEQDRPVAETADAMDRVNPVYIPRNHLVEEALTAATAVGATGIGPSVMTLRQYPDLVDRAAAAGRVTYCWTVDEQVDVQLCADLGVRWLATNHPAKVRDWLVTVD